MAAINWPAIKARQSPFTPMILLVILLDIAAGAIVAPEASQNQGDADTPDRPPCAGACDSHSESPLPPGPRHTGDDIPCKRLDECFAEGPARDRSSTSPPSPHSSSSFVPPDDAELGRLRDGIDRYNKGLEPECATPRYKRRGPGSPPRTCPRPSRPDPNNVQRAYQRGVEDTEKKYRKIREESGQEQPGFE